MTVLIDKSGPYAHAATSVQRTMTLVLAALAPATLFNVWLFGWPALNLFLVTLAAALATEALCLRLANRPLNPTLWDGSAVLTGWLLAMSLPPWAPWWIGAVGGFVAIALGKHVFGGIGQNLFNPAMVARVALLISFPVPMTAFTAPAPIGSADAIGFAQGLAITFGGTPIPDAVSAASALGLVKTELSRGVPVSESMAHAPQMIDLALGMVPGSFGETSALLILLGGLFLIAKRIITWHIPVAMMATVFGLGWLFHAIDPARYADGIFHLLSGATLLGAFFIATDYVTSPVSKQGQLVFGIGIGLLTWVIRTYAGYPEGVAFAVLLMNSLSPLIDRGFRPRVFGRTRKGEPLPAKGGK
ncbi:MAG TPA: RnfABCDGE type electron transport complex subunit D [Candidatus Omnitrophota bacterium]|nr:RnfABCDGE type electron transport complex subunit D [Candidatus Omnitrophota bacterium]